MPPLNADECRVLGVLVEKALTTPQQYPLTLNSMVSGANQKSNRHPVTNLDEDDVLTALDSLRAKDMVREVQLSGSRVAKFRHIARETLQVETNELVILAELMLRGPQTSGEIRGRASRMHSLDSIEVVETLLDGLIGREPPFAVKLSPAPGTRAPHYAQLLCPDLHPTDVRETPARGGGTASSPDLTARIDALEAEVEQLKLTVARLAP